MMRGTPVLPSHFGGAPGDLPSAGPWRRQLRWCRRFFGRAPGRGRHGPPRGLQRVDARAHLPVKRRRGVFSPAASRACSASPRYTNKKRVATASSSGTTQMFALFVMQNFRDLAQRNNSEIWLPKKESLNCGVAGSSGIPRCWRRADMA